MRETMTNLFSIELTLAYGFTSGIRHVEKKHVVAQFMIVT